MPLAMHDGVIHARRCLPQNKSTHAFSGLLAMSPELLFLSFCHFNGTNFVSVHLFLLLLSFDIDFKAAIFFTCDTYLYHCFKIISAGDVAPLACSSSGR
jgi:hypothetical protein